MDHALLQAQVAGCVAHGASASLTWTHGDNPGPVSFAAIIAAAEEAEPGDRNQGDDAHVAVTVAATELAAAARLPAQGDIFFNAAFTYRVMRVPRDVTAAALTYLCASAPAIP